MPGEKSTAGRPVNAICPRCGRRHRLRISLEMGGDRTNRLACEWAGRGTPRIYCHQCKVDLGLIYGGNCPRLEYDTIEGRL